VIQLVVRLGFAKLLTPVGTRFWKRARDAMMVIPPLGTAVTQAFFWRIPNLVTLLSLAKLVLHLALVAFVILPAEHPEYVRQRILVATQSSKPGKVAMTEILPVETIVLLLV
jgi:hypothetical protein